MKRKIRKILAMLLCLAILMGSFSSTCLAASKTSGKCGKNAKWSYNKKKKTLTISGKGKIHDGGWSDLLGDKKTTVVIKNGITDIEKYSFEDVIIKDISFPSTLKSIKSFAFIYSKLPSTITIPKNVNTISKWAFSGNPGLKSFKVAKDNKYYTAVDGVLFNKNKMSLICCPSEKKGKYNIPDGVKTINHSSFEASKLTSITIPKSVKKIGDEAFLGCRKLKNIKVVKGNKYYTSEDGVLFNKAMTSLIFISSKKTGSYTIPDGVETLEDNTFDCSALTEVIVPASVKTIKPGIGSGYGGTFEDAAIDKLIFKGRVPDGLSDVLDNSYVGVKNVYFPKEYYNEWHQFHTTLNNSNINWFYYW